MKGRPFKGQYSPGAAPAQAGAPLAAAGQRGAAPAGQTAAAQNPGAAAGHAGAAGGAAAAGGGEGLAALDAALPEQPFAGAFPGPAQLFDLGGKVALVTGASRGLGQAMAGALAAAGALVFVNSRDPEGAEAAADQLRQAGLKARALAFDASQSGAAEQAVQQIAAEAGRLDILVGNTAASVRKPFAEMEEAEWQGVLAGSLTPAWRLARAAAPIMRGRGHGRMVFTSSINARIVRNEMAGYAAAKAGLEGLVRALAVELAPDGITVNAIAPGYFTTQGNAALRQRPGMTERISGRIAMGRWGRPPELAGAVLYLASPASSYTTGTVLTVDGGLVLTI